MRVSLPTNSSSGPAAPGVHTWADIELEQPVSCTLGADVGASELGDHTTSRRALQKTKLQQIGLVDVLDRVRLLAERDRERREAHRPTTKLVRDRGQQVTIDLLQPGRV